jgi:hypothetical protein
MDLGFLAHRARCSCENLSHADIPTGVTYGFLEQLRTIAHLPRICSNKVLFFGDSPTSFRRDMYPEYKQKRKENRTPKDLEQIRKMYDQVNVLRWEVLPAVGFPVYGQKGLESDDLIAESTLQLERRMESGIMVTSDGDLFQCINKYVTWFDPQRDLHLTVGGLERHKGVSPGQWRTVKAAAGCASDNVSGIPGIGEVGAIQHAMGTLPVEHRKHKIISSLEGQRVLSINYKLVGLPHIQTRPVKLREPVYNQDVFFQFCESVGIATYLEGPKHKQWLNFFRGVFPTEPRRRA